MKAEDDETNRTLRRMRTGSTASYFRIRRPRAV